MEKSWTGYEANPLLPPHPALLLLLSPQVYWAYIVGMLKSLGKMNIDKIHSTLRMFAMQGDGSQECSQVTNSYSNTNALLHVHVTYPTTHCNDIVPVL